MSVSLDLKKMGIHISFYLNFNGHARANHLKNLKIAAKYPILSCLTKRLMGLYSSAAPAVAAQAASAVASLDVYGTPRDLCKCV